jgi:hypothetical protein
LNTQATFHFEHDEDGFFDAVERGDYDGDTIMDEIVAWEKVNCTLQGEGEGKMEMEVGVKMEASSGEVVFGDLTRKGTSEDPIVID